MKLILNVIFAILVSNTYCSAASTPPVIPVAFYDEIKDLPNHPEKLLIDVREPAELQETGTIPTSINVPLNDVKKALSNETSDDEFLRLYGHIKPAKNSEVIFSCRSGKRAGVAATEAVSLGYTEINCFNILCGAIGANSGSARAPLLYRRLGDVANALSLNDVNFESLYGREKPDLDSEIIFMCKIGKRSLTASNIAHNLGYTDVKNYEGSWIDWANREGLPQSK